MNYISELKKQEKISEKSKINVKTCPPHKGNFFSGWYLVEVDGIKMQVYGSSPAILGASKAESKVKEEIRDYLEGSHPHPPQSKAA